MGTYRLPIDDVSVSTGLLRNLLETIEHFGVERTPFLTRNRINAKQLATGNTWLPLKKYIQVTSDILKANVKPALGILAGDRMALRDQGLFGYAVVSCANLLQAIDVYRKYAPLNGSFIFGDIQFDDGEIRFVFDASVLDEWPDLQRFEVEQEFALWFKVQSNWRDQLDWFTQIDFAFRRPDYAKAYIDYFGCPVHFSQPVSQITFNAKYLDIPFSGADEAMFLLSADQCERVLEELPRTKGLVGEIRTMLARSVARYPSFVQVAEELNMSEPTLRRRLVLENTSYKLLLRKFRVELATRYLTETKLSVADVGYLTGYSDPASFNRAFTATAGVRPGSLRID